MAHARLIIIAGLPGAGKTTYLQQLKKLGEVDWFYDDFQDRSFGKSPDPRHSRYYGSLIKHLKHQKTIAVADIRYCVPSNVHQLLAVIRAKLPLQDAAIELRYFQNDPKACLANAQVRASLTTRDFSYETELINDYTRRYVVLAKFVRQPAMPVRPK